MMKATQFSFGGTAAVVTNMALIIGLTTASAAKPAIVSGLLIVAVADNLTDSLSIHLYQESECLEPRAAFRSTLTNFVTRLLLSLVFIFIVLALPYPVTVLAALGWGVGLLIVLSAVIAKQRGVSLASEAGKHVAAAVVIIAISRAIGIWVPAHLR